MSYLQAVLLGFVQGITEFLPVSSSGHLALLQHWMHLDAGSERMILFDLAVHLGTLVAVVLVFGRRFSRFAGRLLAESDRQFNGRRFAWPVVLLMITANIPTAAIGLTFKDRFAEAFGKPHVIAAALCLTGALLWATGKIPRPKRGLRRFSWWRALVIGIGQGLAITPGLSRSGTTIALAIFVGIKRRWSGEFSFLIAFPAICGATILEAADLEPASGASLTVLLDGPLLIGTAAATVTGYVALRLLMVVLRRAKLHYFCYYCWALAAVVWLALR